MDMLKQLNAAIDYVEENLCGEINADAAAKIACLTGDIFLRFFSYMTGMTFQEYIRRRRLSVAVDDLGQGNEKILDIAAKYGYESVDAFSRAFKKQHGSTPSAYRRAGGSVKIYPPASFHITIKGAKEMNLRIVDAEERSVCGVSKEFDSQKFPTREALRHSMWAEDCDFVPGKICGGKWNQPGDNGFDGLWYGLWHDGKYMIAREQECTNGERLEKAVIAKGRYAAFTTEPGGLAWEEFPKLVDLIFNSWLPSSKYELRNGDIVEIYHLWSDHEIRKKNRYYEVWIPIEPKKNG